MHHQQFFTRHCVRTRQRLLAQPCQELCGIGCLQHFQQGVAPGELAPAMGSRQQVQVMVAQKGLDAAVRVYAAAQGLGRFGAPVDQVAQQIDRVAAGGEVDFGQQTAQSAIAALDIADTVK